jgi:hypothetical protein
MIGRPEIRPHPAIQGLLGQDKRSLALVKPLA